MRRLALLLSVLVAGGASLLPHPLAAADKKGSRVVVDLYVDRRENKAFLTAQEEESGFKGFVYDIARTPDDRIEVQPADGEIMGLWKGNAPIRQDAVARSVNLFEAPYQFAPVFLVIDMINEGSKTAQVVGGYLDVQESVTDLQPFFVIPYIYYPYCGGDFPVLETSFEFMNRGWGDAQNAQISYSFDGGTDTDAFVSAMTPGGEYANSQSASIADGLKSSGVDLARLTTERFACPSVADVPTCAQDLAQSGLFGELSEAVLTDETHVLTRVLGSLKYDWTDNQGRLHQRLSPFSVDIPLLKFDAKFPAECGAGGPIERTYKTVKLSLDRNNYRVPLPYKGRLARKQSRRFALSLVADKSSQHMFRVVLQLADGTSVSSPEVDLLYFMPRFPYTN